MFNIQYNIFIETIYYNCINMHLRDVQLCIKCILESNMRDQKFKNVFLNCKNIIKQLTNYSITNDNAKLTWMRYLLKYDIINADMISAKCIDNIINNKFNSKLIKYILKSNNPIIKNNNQKYLTNIINAGNIPLLELISTDARFDLETHIENYLKLMYKYDVYYTSIIDKYLELVGKYHYKCSFNNRQQIKYYFINGYYNICYLAINNGFYIDNLSFDELYSKFMYNKSRDILNISIHKKLKISPIAPLIIDILWYSYGKFLLNSDILQWCPYDISNYIIKLLVTVC